MRRNGRAQACTTALRNLIGLAVVRRIIVTLMESPVELNLSMFRFYTPFLVAPGLC